LTIVLFLLPYTYKALLAEMYRIGLPKDRIRPQTTTNDRRRPQTSIEMTANERKRLQTSIKNYHKQLSDTTNDRKPV